MNGNQGMKCETFIICINWFCCHYLVNIILLVYFSIKIEEYSSIWRTGFLVNFTHIAYHKTSPICIVLSHIDNLRTG